MFWVVIIGFLATSSALNLRPISFSSNFDNSNVIKLPILQIYRSCELMGEFICGTELINGNADVLKIKIDATLKSLLSSSSRTNNISNNNNSNNNNVINIYSSDQINEHILNNNNQNDIFLLYLSRPGCEQCDKFDNLIFKEIITNYNNNYDYLLLKANVDYITDYMNKLKIRLDGTISELAIEDCIKCQNIGFIPCNECNSKGTVIKGSMSIICSNCVGYKKIRCTNCGGKCLKCNT